MKLFAKSSTIPGFNKSLKNLSREQWKEIPGTDGHFLISNYGRVKALPRFIQRKNNVVGFWTQQKIMSQFATKVYNQHTGDYTFGLIVTLQFEHKAIRPSVRRLVYDAFVQPRTKEKMEGKLIYNKDGNGLNNYYTNLGIGTKSELRKIELSNKRYIPPAFMVDPKKNRKHLLAINKGKRKAVIQYLPGGQKLGEFPSITIASKKTAVSISSISACANNDRKQSKGFRWRFADKSYEERISDLFATTIT